MNEPAQLRPEVLEVKKSGTPGSQLGLTSTRDEASHGDLSELMADFVPALPLASSINSTRSDLFNDFTIAAFAFVNLALVHILISLDYFGLVDPSIKQDLSYGVGIAISLVSFPLAYFASGRIFLEAYKQLTRYAVSVDLCFSLAIALGLSNLIYGLIFNREALASSSLDRSLISVIFIINLMRLGEAYLFDRIKRNIGFDLRKKAPEVRVIKVPAQHHLGAHLEKNSQDNETLKEELISVNNLKLGDLVRSRVGDIIVADGVIIGGVGRVYERKLSGLEELRLKQIADHLYAGSRIEFGTVEYRVTALPDESFLSTFSQVLNSRILKDAKEQFEKLNHKQTISNLMIIALALSIGGMWGAKLGSFNIASGVAISLLLISIVPKYLQLSWFIRPFAETAAFYRGGLSAKNYLVDMLADQKVLVLDLDNQIPSLGLEKVSKFELIDKRIDENSLQSVLFALASRGIEREAQLVLRFITEKKSDLGLQLVEEFQEIPGRGFYGKVGGFEFSVGNEDFLLDRGVIVQQSEVNTSVGEITLYVALGDEVIASLVIASSIDSDGAEFVKRMKNHNIRTVIISKDIAAKIDEIGKRLGLELPDVYGGMSDENIKRKLASLQPLSLITFNGTASTHSELANVTLSHFDELRWDVAQSNVSLYSRAMTTVSDIFTISKRMQAVYRQNFLCCVMLSLLLFPLAGLGLITPIICIGAILTASWGMLLNVLRISQ